MNNIVLYECLFLSNEDEVLDTELLKTFLEVTNTRHFGRAADNLFLTQSAVSFRIRHLESQLANQLFLRQRGNLQLTSAGERLLPYAESILQMWGLAKHDIALSENLTVQITLGASAIFWEFDGISDWINRISTAVPGLALRLESVPRQNMSKRLLDKSVDISITSEPPIHELLNTTKVRDYQLQLVTHKPNCDMDNINELPLIYLDWSTRFSIQHNKIEALQRTAVIHTDSCRLALDHIIGNGGVGYLPSPVIAQSIDSGLLYLVKGAPVMEQALYIVCRADHEKQHIIDSLLAVPFNQIIEGID
ncbi:LysR family transcriptional regulator [Moritella sp.]|uniref:LysR family transcriptional regulator n=1 Tax=Moritella sp. TaxID=78556 RepID=UPI0025DB0C5B|nr:LysR family transcriptional regulator [Moritella sp.]